MFLKKYKWLPIKETEKSINQAIENKLLALEKYGSLLENWLTLPIAGLPRNNQSER